MASNVFPCVICGLELTAAPGTQSWSLEYRGVLRGPDGVQLTGVGNHVPEDELRAPQATDARWDDPGHSVSEDILFGAMRQSELEGRYGFVFHESCWKVLKSAAHPFPIVHQRLFDACRSIPMTFGVQGLDWGHDYGGLLIRHDNRFPWERWRQDRGNLWPHDLYGSDPYAIPELDSIMTEPPQHPPRPSPASLPIDPRESARDPFEYLPPELCHAIAAFLSTSDALQLRLASKAFHGIFESQQFWATRFASGGERSWFFETQEPGQRRHDWRWLFRRTNSCNHHPALVNRKRVWLLSRKLVSILDLQEPLGQLSGNGVTEKAAAACALWELPTPRPGRHPSHVFGKGCRALYSQHQRVPDDLARISVYTVPVGDSCFIAGMEFHTSSGTSRRLGYKSDREEVLHISRVSGFVLAIGSRGIQAIQCISPPNEQINKWLGNPTGVPRTARLAASTSLINGVKVAFDGCKLVSMAVERIQNDIDLDPQTPRKGAENLRYSMIWYPDLPCLSCIINKPSLIETDKYPPAYLPLFWSHFGGSNGCSLSRLSRISSPSDSDSSVIEKLEFFYDGSSTPSQEHGLGCAEFDIDEHTGDFRIDGPGGERITQVEVGRSALGGFHLFAIKVTTNLGRSHRFGRAPAPSRDLAFRILEVARDSTITGLYAHQPTPDYGPGFTALGVISERLT